MLLERCGLSSSPDDPYMAMVRCLAAEHAIVMCHGRFDIRPLAETDSLSALTAHFHCAGVEIGLGGFDPPSPPVCP